MVRKIAIFAVIATACLAAQTDANMVSLTARAAGDAFSPSQGFTADAASALQACVSGAISGSVTSSAKKALASWSSSNSGKSVLGNPAAKDVKDWCNGKNEHTMPASMAAAITSGFQRSQWGSSSCNIVGYTNTIISPSHQAGTLVVSPDIRSQLSAFISSSNATATDKTCLSALKTCANGGVAASLSSSAQMTFRNWVTSNKCPLNSTQKSQSSAWLTGRSSGNYGCSGTGNNTAITSPTGTGTTAGVPTATNRATTTPGVTSGTRTTTSRPTSTSITPFTGASAQLKAYPLGALLLVAVGTILAWL